ncbi:MAG: TIGR02281 family clan AA aspartic protease [Pseudomonadota bacterium]
MRADLLGVVGILVIAVIGVRSLENRDAETDDAPAPPAAAAYETRESESLSPYQAGWRKEVRVRAGFDRQFHITAAVNRQPTAFLIDTGASFVALRESDARRAGIYPSASDYTARVSTANGITTAARVSVEEIEIQGLRVRHVDAFILPDDQLGINLLGMSYLSELRSFEARGGELILRG